MIKSYAFGYNMIDLIVICLTTTFLMDTLTELRNISLYWLRFIATLDSLLLIMKMFDWLRLFDTTAFYVNLIQMTISQVLPFLLIYLISLLMISVPMSMIGQI